jgi:TPP-dependent pyruvate/acetoin dehydrogenase alpha subunit
LRATRSSRDDIDELTAQIDEIVRRAVEFGLASPEPDPAEAFAFVRPSLQEGHRG